MTPKKKLEITVSFYRTGKFLNNLNHKITPPRCHSGRKNKCQVNKNSQNSKI